MAYIIYTSGTTGTPKGCVVGVESLLPIVDSFVQYYGLDAQSRVTFCANTAFDAGMLYAGPVGLVGYGTKYVTEEYVAPALDEHTDYFDHVVDQGNKAEDLAGKAGIENETAKKVIGGTVAALTSIPGINMISRIPTPF